MKNLLVTLILGITSVALAQDRRLAEITARIDAYEKDHPRKYIAGVISDVMGGSDDFVEYLLCTQQDGECTRYSQWVIVENPERGMRNNPEGAGGIGTTPDGRNYYGYGWFQRRIKNAVFLRGVGVDADLFDAAPNIAKLYEERAPLLEAVKEKQKAAQTIEDLEWLKTVETRTVKISEIVQISGDGEHGLMLHVIPENKNDLKNIDPECPRCAPAIYVSAVLVPKLGPNYRSWRRLEPGLGRVDGPAVNGQVPGAYATVDVFPCTVKNAPETRTCVADIRDLQPNKNRYNN